MPECQSVIRTEKASRYLQQLCKHFAHKVKSECDAAAGRVEFPMGLCHILAETDTLTFYCQSSKTQGLLVMQGIIENHLERFAWREEIEFPWESGLREDTPAHVRREFSVDAPALA